MRDTDHRSALQGILQTVPCAAVGMDEKIHVCLCVYVRVHASEPDDSTKVKAYPVHSRAQCVTSHFNYVYIYLNWDIIDT